MLSYFAMFSLIPKIMTIHPLPNHFTPISQPFHSKTFPPGHVVLLKSASSVVMPLALAASL